jgi:transposase
VRDFWLNFKQKGNQMSPQTKAVKRIKEIRRKTRRKYSTKEKIRIVIDGLRGESSIAELCSKEEINQTT